MRRKTVLVLIGVAVVASIAVLAAGLAGRGNASGAPQQANLAPDFSLPSMDGGTISLSSYRGYPVVLNFWASW